MKRVWVVLGLLLTFQAWAEPSPVSTVPHLDLQRYVGKWYEIASIPQGFQKQCTANTTAEYATAEDGLISVINSCDTKTSERSVANGRAKVVDPASNAKLKVTFVHFLGWQFLAGGDYWVVGLGENYAYSVVAGPSKKYAWILSRTPRLTQEQLQEASQALSAQGFDTCQLLSTPQDSGLQERIPLCQVVKK